MHLLLAYVCKRDPSPSSLFHAVEEEVLAYSIPLLHQPLHFHFAAYYHCHHSSSYLPSHYPLLFAVALHLLLACLPLLFYLPALLPLFSSHFRPRLLFPAHFGFHFHTCMNMRMRLCWSYPSLSHCHLSFSHCLHSPRSIQYWVDARAPPPFHLLSSHLRFHSLSLLLSFLLFSSSHFHSTPLPPLPLQQRVDGKKKVHLSYLYSHFHATSRHLPM
mmetsp:Transcript_25773/g.64999  ORF Transcript_25773/g.64999 Transcript_25773/m.64999 type:complete len:216 (-) Transcript_25773:2836-3483(-)